MRKTKEARKVQLIQAGLSTDTKEKKLTKEQKIKTTILAIVSTVILITIILLDRFTINPIDELCNTIEAGETEKAIELASQIKNYDRYSSYNWFMSLLTQGTAIETRTPLVVASDKCNYEVMEYLLVNGANPNFGGRTNTYPIVAYARSYSSKQLTAQSAEVKGEAKDGIELLLSYGADPSLNKSTPAIRYFILKMNTIRRKGAKSTVFDETQYNILKEKVIKLIEAESVTLEESSRINRRYKTNVLYDLISLNEADMIEYLLEEGKLLECIDAKNERGFTPLMRAVECGNSRLCTTLLNYGADTDLKNNANQTAYELAVDLGNRVIANKIKQYENISQIQKSVEEIGDTSEATEDSGR